MTSMSDLAKGQVATRPHHVDLNYDEATGIITMHAVTKAKQSNGWHGLLHNLRLKPSRRIKEPWALIAIDNLKTTTDGDGWNHASADIRLITDAEHKARKKGTK